MQPARSSARRIWSASVGPEPPPSLWQRFREGLRRDGLRPTLRRAARKMWKVTMKTKARLSQPRPSTGPLQPSADYREHRATWVDVKEKDTVPWGRQQAASLWERLYARYDPMVDGQTVLDVGCSWGYLLMYLSEQFKPARLIGTDIKPWWEQKNHGWNYAALGDRLQFFVGDLAENRQIPDQSVDLILCTSVLQYMTPEQIEANLTRAYDLLRPGGQMILRTRVFTSYIGADLHREIELPYVHLLHGECDLARFLDERRHGKKPPYLNWLTATSYAAILIRSGFEVLDLQRRPNKHAPEVLQRVVEAYPWISTDELTCAELEAQLLRPVCPEDLPGLA